MRTGTRCVAILVLAALALTGVPAAAQDMAGSPAVEVILEVPPYQAVPLDDGTVHLDVDGFQVALIPGYPALPVRVVDVALPAGATASHLILQDVQSETLGAGWRLSPVPAQTDDETVVRLELTERFPAEPVQLEGTHAVGGVAFARLYYFPFQYDPKTGELILTSRLSVEIEYRTAGGRSLPVRHGDLESLAFSNQAQAMDWYATGPEAQASEGYLILTTSALASSAAVQGFVSHKSSLGFSVYVSTSSDWQGYAGVETSDKIRNFLIDKYAAWNLRWLCIIGSAASIPMKTVYPSASDHGGNWPTPTDAYYADLTGNWDADGDGYSGERGEDAADLAAELWVGRIPFDSESVVASILQKTISYATTDGDWRRTALLAMAIQGYTPEGAVETDGGYLGQQMRGGYLDSEGFASYRLYEDNSPASSLPHEGSLSLSNLTATWAGGYGFVAWWGHGNRTGAYRRLLTGSTSYDSPFLTSSYVSGLDNARPSIVFQNSCLNAQVSSTNLASELLNNGAVATIAGTTQTWYYLNWDASADGGNATMAYLFGDHLIRGRKSVGEALAAAKSTYSTGYVWFTGDVQNLMAFNLFGDPSVGLWPSCLTPTLQKPLAQGWNLVSLSNLSGSLPVAEAFASIDGNYSQVFTYDAQIDGGSWLRYSPEADPAANTLAQVDGLHGYWVDVTTPCTLIFANPPLAVSSSGEVPLYAGWNLVSFPKMNAQPVGEALSSIAGDVQLVYASGEDGGWLRHNPSAPGWATGLTTFQPGSGYWIKVAVDTLWTP